MNKILCVLIVGFALFSCSPKIQNSVNPPSQRQFVWIPSQANESTYNCFPSDYASNPEIDSIQVKVFNRWGEILYETTSLYENWICNDAENTNFTEGTYFYSIKYHLKTASSDTLESSTGSIIIISK